MNFTEKFKRLTVGRLPVVLDLEWIKERAEECRESIRLARCVGDAEKGLNLVIGSDASLELILKAWRIEEQGREDLQLFNEMYQLWYSDRIWGMRDSERAKAFTSLVMSAMAIEGAAGIDEMRERFHELAAPAARARFRRTLRDMQARDRFAKHGDTLKGVNDDSQNRRLDEQPA